MVVGCSSFIIVNDNQNALDPSTKIGKLRRTMSDHPLMQAYHAYENACRHSKLVKDMGRAAFARQLRETRTNMGLTVRQLGKIIGTTGSFVNQVEVNHKSILKLAQIEKIIGICKGENHSRQEAGSRSAVVGYEL
jgi:hypothetical protein